MVLSTPEVDLPFPTETQPPTPTPAADTAPDAATKGVVNDIIAAVMRDSKDLRVGNMVRDFIRQLDELLMLDSPRFHAAYRELREAYHPLEIRPAALEGHAYPAVRAELEAFLDGTFAQAVALREAAGEPVAAVDAVPRALLVPHLDPRRAGTTMARAYLEVGHLPEALDELDACVRRKGEITDVFLVDSATLRHYPPALYWLGRVEEAMGSRDAAAERYRNFLELRSAADTPDELADDAAWSSRILEAPAVARVSATHAAVVFGGEAALLLPDAEGTFGPAGASSAGIELTREDECFACPPWLGAEVSGDPRYYNSNLAKRPYRSWA